jgi:hypothetical protein
VISNGCQEEGCEEEGHEEEGCEEEEVTSFLDLARPEGCVDVQSSITPHRFVGYSRGSRTAPPTSTHAP